MLTDCFVCLEFFFFPFMKERAFIFLLKQKNHFLCGKTLLLNSYFGFFLVDSWCFRFLFAGAFPCFPFCTGSAGCFFGCSGFEMFFNCEGEWEKIKYENL